MKESNEQLRQLTSYLQEVREEEQKRIAREVHDELGQQITGLKMNIAWLRRKLEAVGGLEQAREKLGETDSLLDSAVQTIRKIASELRPSVLDDLGLLPALEWQTREFTKRFGIRVDLNTPSSLPEMEPPIATGIFRLYQESLTNIARHAGASRVTAQISLNDSQLTLTVSDNGKGFDLHEARNRKTLGLLIMKERVQKLNGQMEIHSEPGEGTRIRIELPLRK